MKSILFLFLTISLNIGLAAEDKDESTKTDQIKPIETITPIPSKEAVRIELIKKFLNEQKIKDSQRLANSAHLARSGGMGNGGDVIVCADKVVLLDSYEAQKLKFNIDLNNPNVASPSWRSMVNVAVKRLSRVDEVTATKLYDYAMEMVNDFEKFEMYPESRGKYVYLGYDIIGEINDSNHVSTPEGCEERTRQLVSQKVPKFSRDYRYEISKTLWDMMDLKEQSMTILHEAWYRIMLENGAVNSIAARYMNALIASTDFEEMSFNEYLQELKGTELQVYVVPNTTDVLKDKEIIFNLKEHTLNTEENMMCAPNFKLNPNIKKTYSALSRKQEYLKNLKFQKVCFKNSKLTKLVLPVDVIDKGRTLRLPFHQIEFSSATSETPTIIFNEFGKMSHMEDIKVKSLMRMYYVCDGENSFSNNIGCEKGPFIDHDTKVSKPGRILFDNNEKPIYSF